MILKLRTINGRLIIGMLLLMFVLLAITVYAHYLVQRSASQSLDYIETQRELSRAMVQYKQSLQATESSLYQYSTFLSDRQAAALQASLSTLNQHADKFNSLPVVLNEETLRQHSATLVSETLQLDTTIKQFLAGNGRDMTLLRNAIQPVLETTWRTVKQIDTQVNQISTSGIAQSQRTANDLWLFIWVFTGVVFLLLFSGYWFFLKKIRSPIIQLSNSMQHEPGERLSDLAHSSQLDEINRLINAYNNMQNQVFNRQRRLESILDNAAEGIITIDHEGCIESFNIAAQKLFGYRSKSIIGKPFEKLFSSEQSEIQNIKAIKDIVRGRKSLEDKEFEVHGKRKDGVEFFMSVKLSDMYIGKNRYITAIVDDITERRATMDRLRHLAEHDSLTGLHNRQYFNEEVERFFAQTERRKNLSCACLYIDLDNFKYVNDTLGHLEGDRLLIGIASTLQARTRKSDVLARLGGDEFALLLVGVNEEQVMKVADAYRNAIANFSFVAGGKHIDTGCSIGVAMYEEDIETKEGLLARADIACHMAKRAGRNRVHLFRQEDKGKIDTFYEEMGWTRRIRHALENRGFVFSCQPILRVADETIFSHELLLRMLDPDSGEYIMPSGFLDSAERFGLMPQIDQWVIEHAFEWLNKQPSYNEHLRYFINLSGKSIGDKNILKIIREAMPSLKIQSSHVVFEITEDVAISNLDAAKYFLSELRKLGFKTAIDDFGVGYSSFSYLRELDVDFVKIDGSFINTMHTDEMNYALVKAINDICHILGKFTIAEFVQNETALKLLKEIGVDYAQGYNIATAEDYDQHTIQFIMP